MLYNKKTIKLWKNAPFKRGTRDVLYLPVTQRGQGLANVAELVFEVETRENIRLTDGGEFVAVMPARVDLAEINYLSIEFNDDEQGLPAEYYFVEGFELMDTLADATEDSIDDVGAVAFSLRLDVWNTYAGRGRLYALDFQGAPPPLIRSGILTGWNDLQDVYERSTEIDVKRVNFLKSFKKPQIQPAADVYALAESYYNTTPPTTGNAAIFNDACRWSVIVIYAEGSRIRAACTEVPLEPYTIGGERIDVPTGVLPSEFPQVYGIEGGALGCKDHVSGAQYVRYVSTTSSGSIIGDETRRITIKHIYIVPWELENPVADEAGDVRIFFGEKEDVRFPTETDRTYKTFRTCLPYTATLTLYGLPDVIKEEEGFSLGTFNVDKNPIFSRVTVGTDSHRVAFDEYENGARFAYLFAQFGGDSLTLKLKTANQEIDVTQDFEALNVRDAAKTYFDENKGNIILGSVSSAVSTVAGAATANPIAVYGGLMGAAGLVANLNVAAKRPPVIGGGGYADTTVLSGGIYYRMTPPMNGEQVRRAFMREGVETFFPFGGGFDINKEHKNESIPFEYIRILDADVVGVPSEIAETLRDMFAEGLRIWYDEEAFKNGDYGY